MKQITIELDDAHYKRSHYKRYYTEEEYAKQHKEKEETRMKLYDKTVYESTLIRLKKVSRPRETADETINRLIDEKEEDLCRIAEMIERKENL